MRRVLYPCLLVLAAASAFSQAKFGNEKAITPERLRAHLELVASDEMGGRDTPSLGLDITALYLSTQLKLWGATPGGDNGGFLQKIKLVRGQIDFDKSSATFGGKTYAYGDGFKAAS